MSKHLVFLVLREVSRTHVNPLNQNKANEDIEKDQKLNHSLNMLESEEDIKYENELVSENDDKQVIIEDVENEQDEDVR